MECEISVFDFWEMTYGEVVDTVKAFTNRKQSTLKERAIMDYKLADMIAVCVSKLLSNEVQVPALHEAYEFLFKEESKKQAEIMAKNDMEIWKQRMINFAEYHNRKWGENR